MTFLGNGHSSANSDRKEYFYSVLNVPKSASQHEIRERHRALSVIFHPDKQHDERTKATASRTFLDIQKAYEILSDPFLREVYDILGEQGLKQSWPADLRSKPTEEVREILKVTKRFNLQRELENIIRPKGEVTCGINATSFFDHSERSQGTLVQRIIERINRVQVSKYALHHRIKKDICQKTTVALSSRIAREKTTNAGVIAGGNVLGTIAHQYSPRIGFEATLAFLSPQVLNLMATFRDDETSLFIRTHIAPGFMPLFPPPITASLSRRLFRQSLTEGTVALHTGFQPYLTINVISPTNFDFTSDPGQKKFSFSDRAGSISGFAVGLRYWSCGVTLAGLTSSLRAEWGLTFAELALQVKLGVELGFTGLALLLTGAWEGESTGIAASIGLSAEGVLMRLNLSYLEQRLSIPIKLSQDYDAALALFTAVIPSTAFVLGYHFILKPRRLTQRATFLRASRRVLDEDLLATRRVTEETLSMLKDLASKHMQVESAKEGLVILEASYGPSEVDDDTRDLIVDVTIAVQALVNNSQVYISGHRTKAGIQGFYDPAPSMAKSLRIHYNFNGHTHYAEIPDYISVVLPLEDHIVS